MALPNQKLIGNWVNNLENRLNPNNNRWKPQNSSYTSNCRKSVNCSNSMSKEVPGSFCCWSLCCWKLYVGPFLSLGFLPISYLKFKDFQMCLKYLLELELITVQQIKVIPWEMLEQLFNGIFNQMQRGLLSCAIMSLAECWFQEIEKWLHQVKMT